MTVNDLRCCIAFENRLTGFVEMRCEMNNFVITIARGFGSGGKQMALEIGKKLGIACYEREILDMASDRSGLNRT